MVAAKVSAFTLNASFLVAPAGITEVRLESPVRPESDKPLRFFPLISTKDPFYRRGKIVVAQDGENAAKVLKGKFVRFQERLLACMRIRTVKSPATCRSSSKSA